jgi:hypothetical protein
MPKSNPLSFRLSFNGAGLIAQPNETETQFSAMTRAIEAHAGTLVMEYGRCKRSGEHYRFPVLLANGNRCNVFVEGNA